MLGATDLQRSVAFYRDRLGLQIAGEHPGFAFFDAGGITLGLSTGLAQAVTTGPGDVELVFGVHHVRTEFQALQSRGVEFTVEPRAVNGPNWAANFKDPDGHILSIYGAE